MHFSLVQSLIVLLNHQDLYNRTSTRVIKRSRLQDKARLNKNKSEAHLEVRHAEESCLLIAGDEKACVRLERGCM